MATYDSIHSYLKDRGRFWVRTIVNLNSIQLYWFPVLFDWNSVWMYWNQYIQYNIQFTFVSDFSIGFVQFYP